MANAESSKCEKPELSRTTLYAPDKSGPAEVHTEQHKIFTGKVEIKSGREPDKDDTEQPVIPPKATVRTEGITEGNTRLRIPVQAIAMLHPIASDAQSEIFIYLSFASTVVSFVFLKTALYSNL